MATEQQALLVAQAYRALQKNMGTFVVREQQKAMMTRVLAQLTRNTMGIIQAPTGTGKTMGYVIPGVATAVTEDKQLVISTATASLQDQLASKDMPMAIKAFSDAGVEGLSYVVIKGRERHVCPAKLHALGTSDMFDAEGTDAINTISEAWAGGQWNGQRDSLPGHMRVPQPIWMKVANTSASCSGQACPQFEECPYYEAQAQMKTARIIITNHDYLLATLSSNPNSPLAKGEKNIYVFDEGHHLSDKLLSAFARKLDFSTFWDDDFKAVMTLAPTHSTQIDFAAERARGMWKVCADAIMTMLGDGMIHRFTLGEAPPQFTQLLNDLKGTLSRLQDCLTEAKDAIKSSSAKGVGKAGLTAIADSRINQLTSDINDAMECIEEFTGEEEMARWLSRGRNSIELSCSPFDGASKARAHLWPVVKTGVIASATITTFGKFDSIIRELGLPSNTPTLMLTSPFDYSRAQLVVPKYAVEATDRAHSRMVRGFVTEAMKHNEHQGVLVYFTSKKLMTECIEALSLADRALVLAQGQWQPWSLIEEHKKRIDAGQRSVIFGLDSIGEGVDLPGAYCTQVIVTRLPFPSPDDPVLATHAEFLKDQGKEPFSLLTLPKAALKLAQITGRLIRREGDWGEIVVLDKRLTSKAYGNRLVKSTPFARVQAIA